MSKSRRLSMADAVFKVGREWWCRDPIPESSSEDMGPFSKREAARDYYRNHFTNSRFNPDDLAGHHPDQSKEEIEKRTGKY